MKNMKQSRFILFVLSFLVMSVGNVYAQNVTVTGTVLDSTGEPVIGANVKVAGKSSIGNITHFWGNFSFLVPPGTKKMGISYIFLFFTTPSPPDRQKTRMPSSAFKKKKKTNSPY